MLNSFGKVLIIMLFASLASVTAVSASNTPQSPNLLAGLDVGNAYCVGKNLHVDLEVTINSNLYRVNGTGPNLPSSEIAYPGSFTFTIAGPGEWSGLYLEYSQDGGSSWATSYRPVTPDTISCLAAQANPGPGPDMVLIPEGSVVGTFLVDTPLYWSPEADSKTEYVMTAGQSLWVTGTDTSGQFYQVILSGYFLWVPVESMGPTYDDTWGGYPLPTQLIEE